jgi:hypothetical protein
MYYSLEIAEVNLGGMLFYGLLITRCLNFINKSPFYIAS